MTSDLPRLPAVTRLSSSVIRILGGNPGKFQLQGTNTYLVGQGRQRILIDTGEGKPIWIETLEKVLDDELAIVDQVLLTHWHPDHVGGVDSVRRLMKDKGHDMTIYKSRLDQKTADHNISSSEYEDIQHEQQFETEGATLRAFHCPGHTVDHMAFILRQEDAMFTGDNVLGHGTAVFEDLTAYMTSLEQMQSQSKGRAYPGHGAVIEDGQAKIAEYILHRKKREQEAVEVLGRLQNQKYPEQSGDISPGWSSMELVKIIYKDYPEALHIPAQGSLLQVLNKLKAEGRVVERNGKWSITDGGDDNSNESKRKL